jgi:RNA polymerase sigma-70 factor (ECF subfamily)
VLVSEDIIRKASAGDRASQEVVYGALCQRLYRVVLRIVGKSNVDDVLQEVFLSIFRKMHTFRFDSDFATWSHRVAINEALQFLRRSRRHPTVPLEETQAVSDKHEHAYDAKESFNAAFASLGTEAQLVLELREVEQSSYAQIAESLGIAEGTVASKLNRARGELRVRLKEYGWE